MKSDFYTKTILTVIAICLTINVLKDLDLIPTAYAKTPVKSETNVLNAKNYGLIPVNADGTIDVNIKSTEKMDVNIASITSYDKLRVIVQNN